MSHVNHQLGPFAPPKEYQFEPELLGKLPRIIPPELRQGTHGLTQYQWMRGLLIVGLICVASAETSFVQTAGMYFLPLKITRWFGLFFMLGALFQYIRDARDWGPYGYVKRGTPFVARVVQLVSQPTMYYNGQPTGWKMFAAIEYARPDGSIAQEWTQSFDLGNSPQYYTTSFHVGEYVTGILDETAKPGEQRKLYGFLGLKPGLGVIPRDPSAVSLSRQLKVIGAVFAAMFGVFWLFIHGLRTIPLVMPGPAFWWTNFAVALALMIPAHLWLARNADRRRKAWDAAQQKAFQQGEALVSDAIAVKPHTKFGTFLAFLLAFLAQIFGLWFVNATFDRSKPEARPAYIDQFIHTTWNGIIRDYSIKWHQLDPRTMKPFGSQESYLTTASHMDSFKSRGAVIQVGAGALGWAWVRELEPYEVYMKREHPEALERDK